MERYTMSRDKAEGIVAEARHIRGYDGVHPDNSLGEWLEQEINFVRRGHWIPGMRTALQGQGTLEEQIAELF